MDALCQSKRPNSQHGLHTSKRECGRAAPPECLGEAAGCSMSGVQQRALGLASSGRACCCTGGAASANAQPQAGGPPDDLRGPSDHRRCQLQAALRGGMA